MWSQISLYSVISSTFSDSLPLLSFLSSLTNSLHTAWVGIFCSQQKCRRPLHAPAELLMSSWYLTLPLALLFCLGKTAFKGDRACPVWAQGEAVPCHAQMITKPFSQSKMTWEWTFDSLAPFVNTPTPQALRPWLHSQDYHREVVIWRKSTDTLIFVLIDLFPCGCHISSIFLAFTANENS